MFQAAFKKFMPTLGAARYTIKTDGLIHFVEARRGRGKSYFLCKVMAWCVRNKVRIVTNSQSVDFYRVALMCTQLKVFDNLLEALEWCDENVVFAAHWDDLLTAHDCMVVLDEVTRLFEGRNGFGAQRTPAIMYDWVQQSRKVRVTIYMAGQSFGWIDKKIAELVDILWVARKVSSTKIRNPDGTPQPSHFYLYGKDPRGAGETHNVTRNMPDYIMSYPFELQIANLYNSWELINLVTGTPSFAMIQDLKAWFKARAIIWEPDAKEVLRRHIDRFRVAGIDPVTLHALPGETGVTDTPALAGVSVPSVSGQNPPNTWDSGSSLW